MKKLKKSTSIFTTICIVSLTVSSCGSFKEQPLAPLKSIPREYNQLPAIPVKTVGWRKIFTGQQLSKLIDSALKNNYDLRSGVQRVIVAGANLKIAKARLLPSISANVSGGLDQYGKYTMNGVGNYDTNFSSNLSSDQLIPSPTPDYFAGFRSSWEIDIWGKLSRKKAAAYNRYLASNEGLKWFKTQIVSEVAELYYELATLDKKSEILKRNITLQQKGLEVVEAQMAGGRATALAVSQFKAQLLATQGNQYQVRQSIFDIENQLNLLVGRFKGKINRDTTLITKKLPDSIYAGIPVEVLLKRPDIKQAELELIASKADLSAARKAFLPSLTLNAYAGYNAFKLPLLFSPGSIATGFLGGLTAPLINRKGLKSAGIIANSSQISAYNNYQKKIIKGFQEVSGQLMAIENYKKAYEFKSRQVLELRNAVSNANELYLAGYASYLEVIIAQASVLNAEIEQVDLKRSSYNSLIGLYRSIGG